MRHTGPAMKFRSPPHLYVSEPVWELEVERIWRGEWHGTGCADQAPDPGDYLCLVVQRGLGSQYATAASLSDPVSAIDHFARWYEKKTESA